MSTFEMNSNVEGTIRVFDEANNTFRDLDEKNYDDDIVVGTVFFSRDIIPILKKYYRIVGYFLLDEDCLTYPIDIRKDDIAILEGTYNCFPKALKKELISYNLIEKPKIIWSAFFFQWQFMADWDVFSKHGSFVEMCSKIFDEGRMKKMINSKVDFIFPVNYVELCSFAKNVTNYFGVDLYNRDYYDEINYVFDSLIKGYHINMSLAEIETYCFYISQMACNSMGE